jgi:hypothetical protein
MYTKLADLRQRFDRGKKAFSSVAAIAWIIEARVKQGYLQ